MPKIKPNQILPGDDIYIRVTVKHPSIKYLLPAGEYRGRIMAVSQNQHGRQLTVIMPQDHKCPAVMVNLRGSMQQEIGFLGMDQWPVKVKIEPNLEERARRSMIEGMDPREPFLPWEEDTLP